ncbi:MAG TPA: ABC transporter substrate-binding protein [Actinomycetota bacterium]|nr:ABC transporter substrate-binding protein [Actinomycetota bacterium]
MRRASAASLLAGVVLALAACGQPQQAAPQQPQQPDACEKDQLNLVEPGVLTVGTDNPAYPPWFEGGTPEGSQWEINDPSTGEGFESAVAYAVADELGFSRDDVQWVEVPFNQSFKPGEKDFDFDINQISYKPARDEAVDFSDSYYDVNQAVVSVEGSPIAGATTIEELRSAKLGAPVGTTSYDVIQDVVQPEEDPGVYDSLNDAISALENGQIDGVVVDLPTAFFIAAVQIDGGVIVGQFAITGEQEYFGMVFEEGNPLVECVNRALDRLKQDGTLQTIQQEWLSDKVQAPVLQ